MTTNCTSSVLVAYLLLLPILGLGQDRLVVERCDAIDQSSPIHNIWVDADGQKWIANDDGLYIVYACDLASPAELKASEASILQIPDGNAMISWTNTELNEIIGGLMYEGDVLSSAYFYQKKDELWIGTEESGLFLLKTKPRLSLQATFNTDNSRLKSDHIHSIAFDESGRQFIGTEDGVLVGRDQRWTLEERYFRFQAMAVQGRKMWLLSEDMIWIVDERDNFEAAPIDPDMVSGAIKDIAFDTSGRLWIASEYLTWYDPITLDYKVFDGADYFTSSFVNCIAVDHDGAVWVGTDDKGLYLIQEASAMTVTCLLEKPLSCEGNIDDAQLVVKINGGQPPYRYVWDKGFSGAEPEGLGAGSYTVTVTDSKGKFEVGHGLVPNPRMTLTMNQISSATHGGNADGVAEVSVEGGVPDYQYAWDNGETTAKANKLAAGNHSVMVIDDNGCRADAQVTIEESIGELLVTLQQTAVSNCSGEQGNEIEAIIEGGLKPYQSTWSNPALRGSKLSSLAPGFYGITVTDQNGTESSASLTIPEPETFEVVTRVVQPATTNQSDGHAIARIRGGHEPFTYEWSNGSTTKTVTNLPAGVHSVVVTDSLGCQASASIELTEDIQLLVVDVLSQKDNPCFAAKEGEISLDIAGGKPPYDISWNQPELTSENVQNLAAGSYSVTVTDQSGLSQSKDIVISEPNEFKGELDIETAATMDSTDGSASVRISGGIPPITYQWDNGEADRIANQLSSGEHSVTVTDGNGCSFVLVGSLDENVAPVAVTHTIDTPITCFGEKTGVVSVDVRGGRPPYSFSWSDSTKQGERLTALAAGYYQVTVTDSEGNRGQTEFLLREPLATTVDVDVLSSASMGEDDGIAIVRLNDSIDNYQILWDNGASTAQVENLSKGMHTVTITDSLGCSTVREIEITEDLPNLLAEVHVTSSLNCFGDDYAAIEISASGGSGNYSYLLNGETVQARIINGLTAGEYKIGVRDSAEQEYTTTIVIGEPPKLTASIEVLEPATVGEENGTARVSVEGGRGPYDFSWSNGFDGQTGNDFASGTYEVLVVDALGCSTTATVEINETILPLRIDLLLAEQNRCSNGAEAAIAATIKGGKGPYSYQWNNGETSSDLQNLAAGEYQVTVTDALGTSESNTLEVPAWEQLSVSVSTTMATAEAKDGKAEAVVQGGFSPYSYKWSNGDVRSSASGLAPGAYSLEVRDDRGCRESVEFNIEAEASSLVASVAIENAIDCAGDQGSLLLDVTGGREPYAINWSTGSADYQVDDLDAGQYSVTITDTEGNTTTKDFTLPEPQPLTLEVQVRPASTGIEDGQAVAQLSGGIGDISYQWSNGATEATASNLGPGQYQVTATDANGCQETAEVEISEDIQDLAIDLEIKPILCVGAADGAATATIRGGKGPYDIRWSNDATGTSIDGLATGDYQVIVTDALGTSTTENLTIEEPLADELGIWITNVRAASTNAKDGLIETRVAGGSPPYSYAWSNGATSEHIEDIGPGKYAVTLTDANGCTTSEDIELSEDVQPFNISLESTAISCVDAADGAAKLNLTGGKPPYTIAWSTGDEGEEITNLDAGTYEVTVTDVLGTEATKQVAITNPEELSMRVLQQSPASTGVADGVAVAEASGGTRDYSFTWSSGSSEAIAEGLAPGEYTVTATDSKGCSTTEYITIDEDIKILAVQLLLESEISCFGDSSATARVEIEGGKGPYNITWSIEEEGEQVTNLGAGTYEVTVTDVLGTEETKQLSITGPEELSMGVIQQSPASTGATDGIALAQVAGGTGDYTYNWSSGSNEAIAEGLAPGEYTVSATDSKGCTITESITIDEDIKALSLQILMDTEISCFGDSSGAAHVEIEGGKEPYTIVWSTGDEGEKSINLSPGTYEVTVTDVLGTEETTQVAIANPEELSMQVLQQSPASTDASDGIAIAEVVGGTGDYTYTWSNGGSGPRAEGLAPGEYTVTVTDSKGCITAQPVTIDEDIKALSVQLLLDADIKCFGDSTGAAHVEIEGGKGPYTVTWNQEDLFGDDLVDLKAGTFQATVVDQSGQEESASLTIDQPDALVVDLVDLRPSTDRSTSDGKAKIAITGGTPPYTILWSDGSTDTEVSALEVGNHWVQVTDVLGCILKAEFEIKQKILPDLTAGKLRSGQVVKMEKLNFEADATQIDPSSQPVLTELFEFLKDNPEIVVQVEGHTNGIPTHEWCDSVSRERARVVAQDIVDRGISGKRVFFKGFGKREPLFSNDTPEGRRKNQRVEIRILRLTDD